MKSEKMVEFSYRCKCGKMVQGWSAKQLTDSEMASLKEREDCESCLLKKLLEKGLEIIDDEICT